MDLISHLIKLTLFTDPIYQYTTSQLHKVHIFLFNTFLIFIIFVKLTIGSQFWIFANFCLVLHAFALDMQFEYLHHLFSFLEIILLKSKLLS